MWGVPWIIVQKKMEKIEMAQTGIKIMILRGI
jgi:hypothetical protein